MEIRDIAGTDGEALTAFRCDAGDPWARDVEESICEDVGPLVIEGSYRAMGAWDDGDLAAVVAWRRYGDEYWWMALLASSLRHRGKGAAKTLYIELIRRARDENVRPISSRVDRGNVQMIGLQRTLDATREVDPNDIDSYLYVLTTS